MDGWIAGLLVGWKQNRTTVEEEEEEMDRQMGSETDESVESP
jgi:hypothetical protein